MRLLLDECVPARLAKALTAHEVRTVVQAGWSGLSNGRLLAMAAHNFDAFIAVDKNMPYQQNHGRLPLAVVVLHANSNELQQLVPLLPGLEACPATLTAGSFHVITLGA